MDVFALRNRLIEDYRAYVRSFTCVARLAPLVLGLTCTAPEMTASWNATAEHGWVAAVAPDGPPPGIVDEERRLAARAEIEAIVARELFGLTRDELAHVLDSFPIVRRRDEQKHGEYRTRRLVLEAFDAMDEG